MRVLIIADSVKDLKPDSDTSLYFLREFIQQKHSVWWAVPSDIAWVGSGVRIRARACLEPGSRTRLPKFDSPERFFVEDFSLVLIRKEPPFDDSYTRLCWFLDAYEGKVYLSNKASVLLRHHEKMFPLLALAQGVLSEQYVQKSCITEQMEEAVAFAEDLEEEKIVLKPWLGHGGRDIRLVERKEFIKNPTDYFDQSEYWMLQGFLEAVYEKGDRRVLFLGGEYLDSFVRIPKKGSFISNLVQGGQAIRSDLDSGEKHMISKLGPWLEKLDVDFAGADFIDGKLTEINVTCPTGLASVEDLTSENLAEKVVGYMVKKADYEKDEYSAS